MSGSLTAVYRGLLQRRFAVLLATGILAAAGVAMAPFDLGADWLPRSPVPVDAIPDLSENQQIVFTAWPGRSPQDVDDQVTAPLTEALLGMPRVKTIRSQSMFGASSIYVIFEEDVAFYWGRERVMEKLASLPAKLLPGDARPALGPDATALGQVYWYTLEGHDPVTGQVLGGWSLQELRSIQDFLVAPALTTAKDIAEVASVGGWVMEYQVDVDPDALRAYGVTLAQVVEAISHANRDVGARTVEVNEMEHVVRGVGFVRDLADIEQTVVTAREGVPVRIDDVAWVHEGPASRRGALDKNGAEAVGGVAVVRYGANPLAAIESLRAKTDELGPGLPSKVLTEGRFAGRTSRVTIVPFYDRTTLIEETVDTLEAALSDELLVTLIVVLIMLLHLRSAFMIALVLPIAVLATFVGMRALEIDANVVALSGIAIAIGTMVDMAIVVTENIVSRLARAGPEEPRIEVIARATAEVAGAVGTAALTTIVGFLPVFGLTEAEGRLFGPLAWTKTLAVTAAFVVAVVVLPALAATLLPKVPTRWQDYEVPRWGRIVVSVVLALAATVLLAGHWEPLGPHASSSNLGFVAVLVFGLLGVLLLFHLVYERLLRLFLNWKLVFMIVPVMLVGLGLSAWLGARTVVTEWVPGGQAIPERLYAGLDARMPGLDSEFMPDLSEGSFLFMPSTMPHASIGATLEALQAIDTAIEALPEVHDATGKLGRADSALDPAPLSMIEVIVTLEPKWRAGPDGERVRAWRDHIETEQDVWDEIAAVATFPGLSGAPPLQPIKGRIVMLQTGMRAPMGFKVRGPDLPALEAFGRALEPVLQGVEGIDVRSVSADRVVGKPYLELRIDREALGRYGLHLEQVQQVIEVAIGGKTVTRTVEGRASYSIVVRYPSELRDLDEIERILVSTPSGASVPLGDLVEPHHVAGPQMIRREDTFLVSYVTFGPSDKELAESELAARANAAIDRAVAAGSLAVPAGVSWRLAGTWESKERADATLAWLVPLVLLLVVLLLYLQFGSLATTLMVFAGVAVAAAGGFVMVWMWGQPWFADVELFGHNLRSVLQVGPMNMSVAVAVGFIALVGIATDDGVVMATYLQQRFAEDRPRTRAQVLEAVVEAGKRRVRPCLMTTATTLIALLPVLTSTGRGSEIMVPMAVPIFGGMVFELVTLFVVPVLYATWHGAFAVAETVSVKHDQPPFAFADGDESE